MWNAFVYECIVCSYEYPGFKSCHVIDIKLEVDHEGAGYADD